MDKATGSNIKCEIEKPNKKVKLEFEVSADWTPQTTACWTECPFAVCTSLGNVCKALSNNLCPFVKGLKGGD